MPVSRKSLFIFLLTVFILLGTGGCASLSGDSSGQPSDPAQAAAMAMAQGKYERAVHEYKRAAENTDNPDKARRYRLEAGLAAAHAGDAETAHQLLDSVNTARLDATTRARYNLAQREIKIADMPPAEALKHLPRPSSNTPSEVAQRVWEKRAELHFDNHAPIQGLNALVERDEWLEDEQAQRANDNRTYDKAKDIIGLGVGPQSKAAKYASETTRGWLALADLGQQHFDSSSERDQALEKWQQTYPHHPANRSVLSDRLHYDQTEDTEAKEDKQQQPQMDSRAAKPANGQVALALPLGGDFGNAAQAIHDGFMFAYENNPSGLPKPIVYDTTDMAPEALTAKAKSDDIGILVGPLAKPKMQAMSKQELSIPQIALNSSREAATRPGFYQFALAPEDDAQSVAAHAHESGYEKALVLVPQGDWGDRVLDSFSKAFQAHGGTIIAQQSYDAKQHDHTQAIQDVLKKQSDADFIFVAAQPTQARLIRAQLKYYHAETLPMLATSHAYSGQPNPRQDTDLNDVHFVDMPWLLGTGDTIKNLRDQASDEYGAKAESYGRLFAMGMDAWLLAREMEKQDGLSGDKPIEGMTGVLSIQPNGYIRRYLGWAVFHNGKPDTQSLPSLDEAQQVDQRIEHAREQDDR